jgi:DNA-binding PadR family transcriptional regulator
MMNDSLGGLGRYSGPATLILSSLAAGEKHGYALMADVSAFAGVRLAPGTLYAALERLVERGLIEALPGSERRHPYRLTALGASALASHLAQQRAVVDAGLKRLATNWGLT